MNRNPRPTSETRGARTTALAAAACRPRPNLNVKSTIPKQGPPPALPKKVDYKRPGMTKAMEQRLRHAQKFQEELERKEREKHQQAATRRTKRCPTPVCGDSRAGRERRPREQQRARPISKEPPSCGIPESEVPGSCPAPSRTTSCPRRKSPASTASAPVSSRTRNLAKSMNADIVQAEPLQAGPVDNVIIPPGAINSEKTTIVSIPQPVPQDLANQLPSSTMHAGSQITNKSIAVISETLDEQDAVESAVVNNKLQDLQQARRDFVMTVANVGGNALSLQDEELANITPIGDITPPPILNMSPGPPSPHLVRCPSIEGPYLQVEYGRHHPTVESAREFLRNRQVERLIEDDFARAACQQPLVDLEGEILEGCGIVPGSEEAHDLAYPPTQFSRIPARDRPLRYNPYEMEELEQFLDLERYPPTHSVHERIRPPPGREHLPPDLWELDDPWSWQPEVSDFIKWDDEC